ncbi:MAG: hypothetical protein RL709_325 [Pseudomonadota bacterium]|jgi:hypothetical protein
MNNTHEVMILWMEDLPIQELASETSQTLVTKYRNGTNDYRYTMDAFEELCQEEIKEWIKGNHEMNNLIDVSEEAM